MYTSNCFQTLASTKTFCLATTVHKDITDRVTRLDPDLAHSVRKVLEVNKAQRHIRGGLATREKYLHDKNTTEEL